MKILVTGATGFVGRALCNHLSLRGHVCIPALRRGSGLPQECVVGDLAADTDWRAALAFRSSSQEIGATVETVVHLAARVHVMNDTAKDPLALYRTTNTDATLNLARQAAQAGVQRFVFVSTIKVNGEGSVKPYREVDTPAPEDPYAISKWEAEQGLWKIARETGMEIVVLRPPLIYGPDVKANFLRLMQAIERGWPLPFGAIHNRRSLLYLENFTHAIRLCIEHPAAAGRTFLLDDGEAISTPDLCRAVAKVLHRRAHVWPVPVGLLKLAGWLSGKSAAVARLTSSLYVDSQAIRTRLGWVPPYTMSEGLTQTVAAFVQVGVLQEAQ